LKHAPSAWGWGQTSYNALSHLDVNDSSAPWNKGTWLGFNDRNAAKTQWILQNDDTGLMDAGRTVAAFTPVVGSGLLTGNAITDAQNGDWLGAGLNGAFAAGSLWLPGAFKLVGEGLSKAKGFIKTSLGIHGGKNALKVAGTWADKFYEFGAGMIKGSMGIANKVKKLTPTLGFNLSDEALHNMLRDDFYGNMRTGTRSSTSDSMMNRIAVEHNMMGIPANAPSSKTPAYGFLTTKEDVPSTYGSIWNQGQQTPEQSVINNFNQLINPYSRYLQRYGYNTIKLKPNVLGKATMSMGDSLSVWDQALRLGQKNPGVQKFSSIFSTYPALHGILEYTQNMMRKEIPGIKTPTGFPYIEGHLPGGFGIKDIDSIILHANEDKFGRHNTEKIAADLAERKAALEALFDSLGIKNIRIKTNAGTQYTDSLLPAKGSKTPMFNWQALIDTLTATRRSVGPNILKPNSSSYVGNFGPGRYYGTDKQSLLSKWGAEYGDNLSKMTVTPKGLWSIITSKGYMPYEEYAARLAKEQSANGGISLDKSVQNMTSPFIQGLLKEGYIGTKKEDGKLLTSWILGDQKGIGIKNIGEWTRNNLWTNTKNPLKILENAVRTKFGKNNGIAYAMTTGEIVQRSIKEFIEKMKSKYIKPKNDELPDVQGATGGLLKDGKFHYANGGMAIPRFKVGGYVGMMPKFGDGGLANLHQGEYVFQKSAVDRIGLKNLNAMNQGDTISGDSVYNYSININVKSDSNADQIADNVLRQIKQIDSQRLRSVRV